MVPGRLDPPHPPPGPILGTEPLQECRGQGRVVVVAGEASFTARVHHLRSMGTLRPFCLCRFNCHLQKGRNDVNKRSKNVQYQVQVAIVTSGLRRGRTGCELPSANTCVKRGLLQNQHHQRYIHSVILASSKKQGNKLEPATRNLQNAKVRGFCRCFHLFKP